MAGALLFVGAACSSTDLPQPKCIEVAPTTGRVGYRLEGIVHAERSLDGRSADIPLSTKLYFPRGRKPNAPVQLNGGPDRMVGKLDARSGFTSLSASYWNDAQQQVGYSVAQVDPQSAFTVSASIDLGKAGSYVSESAFGDGTLCITEVLTEPVVMQPDFEFSLHTPRAGYRFLFSGPVDLDSYNWDLSLLADGKPMPGYFSLEYDDSVTFRSPRVTPPNARLELTTGTLRSYLGTPVQAAPMPEPLVTTAVVSDLTFAAAPPAGAALSVKPEQLQVADGQLQVGNIVPRKQEPWFYALVALGDPGQASKARLRSRLQCPEAMPYFRYTHVMLVTADGQYSGLALTCANDWADVELDVPGPGPLWLTISNDQSGPLRPFDPPAPGELLLIDEIAFE